MLFRCRTFECRRSRDLNKRGEVLRHDTEALWLPGLGKVAVLYKPNLPPLYLPLVRAKGGNGAKLRRLENFWHPTPPPSLREIALDVGKSISFGALMPVVASLFLKAHGQLPDSCMLLSESCGGTVAAFAAGLGVAGGLWQAQQWRRALSEQPLL